MPASPATDKDCRSFKVKAHEVEKIGTTLLLRRMCAVRQVLKVSNYGPTTLIVRKPLLSNYIWFPYSK